MSDCLGSVAANKNKCVSEIFVKYDKTTHGLMTMKRINISLNLHFETNTGDRGISMRAL